MGFVAAPGVFVWFTVMTHSRAWLCAGSSLASKGKTYIFPLVGKFPAPFWTAVAVS
jgi:hypothetical protein